MVHIVVVVWSGLVWYAIAFVYIGRYHNFNRLEYMLTQLNESNVIRKLVLYFVVRERRAVFRSTKLYLYYFGMEFASDTGWLKRKIEGDREPGKRTPSNQGHFSVRHRKTFQTLEKTRPFYANY